MKINKKEFLKTLGLALLFAMIFRSFFFQPFAIPSGSMMPNLIVGDKLLVQKFAYGYSKYSFPLNMFPFSGKILDKNHPQRGDIVIFKMPEHGNEYFIKRVVGIPGDKIEIKRGVVYINGIANSQKIIKKQDMYDTQGRKVSLYTLPETNNKNFSYFINRFSMSGNNPQDNFAPITIPQGYYFMLGDNRDNSKDSRFPDMGLIASDRIIGKARIIFFSSSAKIYELHKFLNEIYWKRIGNRLDKNVKLDI